MPCLPNLKLWVRVFWMTSAKEHLFLSNLVSFGWILFVGSLMQADGDLEDLEQVLEKKEVRHVFGSGSCSALIKVLPGNKDLYISQVTWTSYAQMLRVFKLYDIGVTVRGSAGECCWTRKYFRVLKSVHCTCKSYSVFRFLVSITCCRLDEKN